MRKILIIGFLFLFLFSGQVLAQPIAKHLIDAEPGEALLLDAGKWFQAHPIEKGLIRYETVFKSPRIQVSFIRLTGAPWAGTSTRRSMSLFMFIKAGVKCMSMANGLRLRPAISIPAREASPIVPELWGMKRFG